MEYLGYVFDVVLLLYFAYSVYNGYRRGFLLSVSGFLAFVVSFIIYKAFEIEYLYFALVYIGLLILITLLARLIRRLKVPLLAKTDAILGTVMGALNGLIGVIIIALAMFVTVKLGRFPELQSSITLSCVGKIFASIPLF